MDDFKNENVEDINELEDSAGEKNTDDKYITAEAYAPAVDKAAGGALKEIYEWTQSIALAVVLALIINQFFFCLVQVEGHSMDNTLGHKQRLVVSRLMYKPKAKDIIIVKSSVLHKNIVKRVIALPGQTLDLDPVSGDVTVDGVVQNEPYIKEKLRSAGNVYSFPYTIPENTVFVMGDNRNNSHDSRMIGVIPFKEIVGKAVYRIWPFNTFGGLYDNME